MTATAFAPPSPPSVLGSAYESTHSQLFVETVNRGELPVVHPLSQYEQDPVGFLVQVLGIPEYRIRWSLNPGYEAHQWDGAADPLVAIAEALRDWIDVAVEAGTGTQKSHTAAGLVYWFLASFYEARVFTFAPKEEQLRAFMWMEMGKLWPRFQLQFPTALITDLRIRMRGQRDGAWGAQGFAVGRRAGEEVSINAQGMHAAHLLLVYEETPGITQAVIEAGENTCTAPHNLRLALGNPDHQLDTLHLFGHDQFGKPRPHIKPIRISALDHPNVVSRDPMIVPGAVSIKSVDQRAGKYTTEGRLYKSRVRGLSPSESVEALIKLEWIRAAQARFRDKAARDLATSMGKAKRALGVDVANSEDGDAGAISYWHGALCEQVEAKACPNANNLGFDVHLLMRELKIEDEHVGVDDVGVGVGAVNELHKRERWIKELGGNDKAFKRPEDETGDDAQCIVLNEDYNNLRSQMYYTAREDLRQGFIIMPDDDPELVTDLITIRWTTRNGRIVVESKEDLKKRLPGGRSTNKGDAFVYGNWVRDRAPLLSKLPKRKPTIAERLQKELEDLDREEKRASPNGRAKFGSTLRQG